MIRRKSPLLFKIFLVLLFIFTVPIVNTQGLAAENWAFEETFNGTPSSPSQALLPKTFDYVATHRTHSATPDGKDNQGSYGSFPADHGHDCSPPNNQHDVHTTHRSNSQNPDQSFFICRDHMMSSMGDVEGYSVSTFYPRQEFDFKDGGILEFDVNINTNHPRSWWEVMIVPREQLQLAAGVSWVPISETYPEKRIVLNTIHSGKRDIEIGSSVHKIDWADLTVHLKGDPALTDKKIRRKMRIEIQNNPNVSKITWKTQKQDGSFYDFSVDMPGNLPFSRGLVVFKTHAYTPKKDGNLNNYTFHWDNIRFSGEKLKPHTAFEIPGVVNLEANGNKPIGANSTVTLNLDSLGDNPVILGQTHGGSMGQVLLSINGNKDIVVKPHSTASKNGADCGFGDWRTFRMRIDKSLVKLGENTFKWTVGPRPQCAQNQWWWDGFSIKAFEIQFDQLYPKPIMTPLPSIQPVATPVVIPTTPTPAAPLATPSPSAQTPTTAQETSTASAEIIDPVKKIIEILLTGDNKQTIDLAILEKLLAPFKLKVVPVEN